MTFKERLTAYLNSGHPCLAVETPEEARLENEILSVCRQLNIRTWTWSCTQGAQYALDNDNAGSDFEADAGEVLGEIFKRVSIEDQEDLLFILRDFCIFLEDAEITRLLRDCISVCKTSRVHIVIVDPRLVLPIHVRDQVVVIDYALPDEEYLSSLLSKAQATADASDKYDGTLSDDDRSVVLESAKGLSAWGAECAFALSTVTQGRLHAETVAREKAQSVKRSDLLEVFEPKDDLDAVGGLDLFKSWLLKRKDAFGPEARSYGLDTPKGVLALGVPGCGKSLLAKATAIAYRRLLLRLDVGKLFAGIVGESESRQRQALALAEAMSPCVLWLDEIEKGLAGSQGSLDSGVSARIFGGFLTWMAEKTAPVFVFATANDVRSLPPELSRKGRFDEIFFVDLPTPEERDAIWRIHLSKRNRTPDEFDIARLVSETSGFTGSEIEEVVKEGLFTSFGDGRRKLSTLDLLTAVSATVPLSRTRKEELEKLRKWASERARPASTASSSGRETTRKLRP